MSPTEKPRHVRIAELANSYPMESPTRLLLLEAAQFQKRNDEAGYEFRIVNIVSQRTGQGMLDVSWGGYQAQLETVKAREIAWMLLEGAAVAESEAAVLRFMKQRVGLDDMRAAQMLHDFRDYRKTGLDGSSLVDHDKKVD
jgi:hypothetical protein